jgi:hypothetical protein
MPWRTSLPTLPDSSLQCSLSPGQGELSQVFPSPSTCSNSPGGMDNTVIWSSLPCSWAPTEFAGLQNVDPLVQKAGNSFSLPALLLSTGHLWLLFAV